MYFELCFFKKKFNHKSVIFVINIINYKHNKFIRFFLFAPLIFSESLTANNIAIFKNLNIFSNGLRQKKFLIAK